MSLLQPLSPVAINTNLLSAGVDYSDNGGWSANAAGWSYSKAGWMFNPSMGVSATAQWGTEILHDDYGLGVTERNNAEIKTDAELIAYLKANGVEVGVDGIGSISMEGQWKGGAFRDENGILRDGNKMIAGETLIKYQGFKTSYSIRLSPFTNTNSLSNVFNHELIHVYHYEKYGAKMDKNSSEYVSQVYENSNNPLRPITKPSGIYSPFDLPSNLIMVVPAYLPHKFYHLY